MNRLDIFGHALNAEASIFNGGRLYFMFSSSRMTIIKASASYFACVSPATTAASLSSIWFQPSN
jgi:hypothetical protein